MLVHNQINHYETVGKCLNMLWSIYLLLFCKGVFLSNRGVFNNASARTAIECFLPERKRSPRCLQALAIQVDRCTARKSKMVTKTIMGFREGHSRNIFRFDFRNDDVCFFVWIYEMEQFKLKVGRCFALISNQSENLICLLMGAAIFY